jgi:hypothetical protein
LGRNSGRGWLRNIDGLVVEDSSGISEVIVAGEGLGIKGFLARDKGNKLRFYKYN